MLLKEKRVQMKKHTDKQPKSASPSTQREPTFSPMRQALGSQLAQWPCRIRFVPENAPYFDGANLLIAADCTAYAYASFHSDFMKNHITLIACPRLDTADYTNKLTSIITENNVKSITVVRMEVSCCSLLESTVKQALQASEKTIPLQVVTVTTDGRIAN